MVQVLEAGVGSVQVQIDRLDALVELLLRGLPALRELRPELTLCNRQNIADLYQPPKAARVVVEAIGLFVVPELKELLDLKLIRFQDLEFVDVGLQLVRDLEQLDRLPIRRQQGAPLRRRTARGNR